jgi:glycosyltransferase involved in cell wall biosynthesis
VRQGPCVSVIVPARNEEACLGACLESLLAQTGVSFEIIVVDDGSTDRTRAVALSHPGVRVMEPGPLPPGWTGKNNAVTAGTKQARGEWLLFTDADTVHKPGSLARAVAEAKEHKAELLSYSPEQEVHGFWERAVMPVIFAELASAYPPARVNDPVSPLAAANGQYLLISRSAYDAVGGHAAVAHSLLEDVALARAVRECGRKIYFRYGGDAARTRMYRSWGQLREGWTKNLSLLFPSPARLALRRGAEFLLGIAGLALSTMSVFAGEWRFAALMLFFPLITIRRIATAHFSWKSNLLSILGLPIFCYLLLRSKRFHRRGTISWKGRIYSGSAGILPTS